ncbi:MAG: hypothetical protein M1839_004137 [Geoglossum umbratile]|nr:MAG: hypothetical protein M1839_004137 [Geoglossum umbratile]
MLQFRNTTLGLSSHKGQLVSGLAWAEIGDACGHGLSTAENLAFRGANPRVHLFTYVKLETRGTVYKLTLYPLDVRLSTHASHPSIFQLSSLLPRYIYQTLPYVQQDQKMATDPNWEPPAGFIEKSKERLTAAFQSQFEQRVAERKDVLPVREAVSTIQRNLAKDDRKIGEVVKDLVEKSRRLAKTPLKDPPQRQAQLDLTLGLPFTYDFTWKSTTGTATASVSASKNTGDMSFNVYSSDGGTASASVGVGNYFRPTKANAILQVFANPSLNFSDFSYNVFDSSHTAGFIGIYVGEYTLEGAFVRAVVDQRISLYNIDGGGSHSGSNSGFSLFASTAVDSSHFYEVWVWAGGDAEGDGWSLFWGSGAGSALNVHVPSMSIFAF